MHRVVTVVILCACAVAAPDAWAIDIDDFVSAENDRFTNDPSFIMNQYNLSGVARSSNARWATLVSRNVFVSSNHFFPAPDGTKVLRFYETNDPNGPFVERIVVDGQRIGASDIWVGVLDSPVPEGYATYDIATQDITSASEFNASVYRDKNAYLFGKTASFGGFRQMGVGRNVLDGWLDNVDAAGTIDDAMTADDELTQRFQVTYEAVLESGDSGGPMFVDVNNDGNLTLVGTNWILAATNPISTASGFAYLGNYDAEIQAFINANPIPDPQPVAVGVVGLPVAPVLLGLGVVVLIRRAGQSAA